MNANDSAFLAALRDEFNAQPKAERFRTGRFRTYEAVMELLREREHAMAAVRRIDTRIHTLLEAERNRNERPVGQYVQYRNSSGGFTTAGPFNDEEAHAFRARLPHGVDVPGEGER